jgi:hypothetical protein
MWHHVDLVRTDVSEERIASIFSVEKSAVCKLPAHAGSSLTDFSTLKMEAIRSYETSVHTRPTMRHIPEDEKSPIKQNFWAVSFSIVNFLNIHKMSGHKIKKF